MYPDIQVLLHIDSTSARTVVVELLTALTQNPESYTNPHHITYDWIFDNLSYFLEFDSSANIRCLAIDGLITLSDDLTKKVIEVLEEALYGDKHPDVRRKCATALTKIACDLLKYDIPTDKYRGKSCFEQLEVVHNIRDMLKATKDELIADTIKDSVKNIQELINEVDNF